MAVNFMVTLCSKTLFFLYSVRVHSFSVPSLERYAAAKLLETHIFVLSPDNLEIYRSKVQ